MVHRLNPSFIVAVPMKCRMNIQLKTKFGWFHCYGRYFLRAIWGSLWLVDSPTDVIPLDPVGKWAIPPGSDHRIAKKNPTTNWGGV